MATTILHKMQNGVEFFLVLQDGKPLGAAVSIRGLARMCGVSHTAIEKLLISLGNQTAPKILETLYGQEFYMVTKITRRGKQVTPIRSKVAVAIIRYYDRLGYEVARQSFDAFAEIGFDSYIQGAVGYLPDEYQESTQDSRYEITRLIREPDPWKRLYSAGTCEKVRSWYFPRDFFWKFAYDWMTPDEILFLNEHNPVIPGIWQRGNRIHQHLSEETRDRLAPEMSNLCILIETSTSKQDFETRYNRAKGYDQKEAF